MFRVVLPAAPVRVSVAAKTLVVVIELETNRLFPSERLDKFETCQTFRVPTFAVEAYKLENVARGPVKFITEETLRACVLMYGIVNVSKKNVALAAFAVIEPLTLNVSVTVTFVRLDVP